MTQQAAFDAIVDQLHDEPGVIEGTGFGASPGLRVHGRIFAMLAAGGLVVKLPAQRCAALFAAGQARPFDRGQGRPLKEWVVVASNAQLDWLGLAREALNHVDPD